MEQTYPGKQDIINHFEYVLPAFLDDRYVKVNGKPFFFMYRPEQHPDLKMFVDTFSELAIEAGFKGVHFVATNVREDWDLDRSEERRVGKVWGCGRARQTEQEER